MSNDREAWNGRLGNLVERPKLDEYAGRYREYLAVERRNGILEVRMHTGGGPALFSLGLKNALGRVWQDVGSDPENEVVILTGTGDQWIAGVDPISLEAMTQVRQWPADPTYEHLYYDGIKLLENLVFGVDVPTIGAINGPGPRKEAALLCDITLCTESTVIRDGNFAIGHAPPGDGMHLALQELLGTKRAAYALLTGETIDARKALELGLVNEVLPADRLRARAWELAEQIMTCPRFSRRLAHGITQRPWKQRLAQDLEFGLAHVSFGARLGLG
jgi:enoyl-CoA hydratase/carnithine racemase